MSLTVNLYYTGKNGSARAFMRDMLESGLVEEIRREEGCLKYAYFLPVEDEETVLLIDQWRDQAALVAHHRSPMMARIAALREKHHLRLRVERYVQESP